MALHIPGQGVVAVVVGGAASLFLGWALLMGFGVAPLSSPGTAVDVSVTGGTQFGVGLGAAGQGLAAIPKGLDQVGGFTGENQFSQVPPAAQKKAAQTQAQLDAAKIAKLKKELAAAKKAAN